jgi:PAS domain S-box-containing protein
MLCRFRTGTQTAAASASYQDEVRRRFVARAPSAFAILLSCGAMATVFEVLRFPERRVPMLSTDAIMLAITLLALVLIRAYPRRCIATGIVVVNALGIVLTAYHAYVGAPVEMYMWVSTALLCTPPILVSWGWRAQALASIGTLASYPLMLPSQPSDVFTWTAGAAYLGWVVGLSTLGAAFIDRYLANQFGLARALAARESQLQSYFDLALVGTAILSHERTVLEANQELCRILGRDPDELVRSAWDDLLPPAERDVDQTAFDDVLRDGRLARIREGALLRRDGTTIETAIALRGLPANGDALGHVIVAVQDLTDRRRAEREREEALLRERAARRDAEAASRAKDEFLAIVSHELRTPLTPILGWLPMLRGKMLDESDRARALGSIERSAHVLHQLIDDLLDVSRIISGKMHLSFRPTEMRAVVEAAVESMRPTAAAKGVVLAMHVDPRPEHVSGDASRLQQVVWNLVSNAIKFTEPGGRVDVEVARRGGFVETRVRDTGKGIDAALLPHVFERFWQAEGGTTRRHGGLGLGLAIVRHLVELHGGTVDVDSPGVGRGATFTVRLPAVVVSAQDRSALAPRATVRMLEGVRALVVDDEGDAQDMARRALELCGVEVRTADSVAQAMQVLDSWTPAVLVSDIAMPDEDGFALIRRVREREQTAGGRLAAVAFTALSRPEDRSRLLAAGFDGYVAKPVDPTKLVDAVAIAVHGTT